MHPRVFRCNAKHVTKNRWCDSRCIPECPDAMLNMLLKIAGVTPDASLVTSDAKTKHVTKNPGVTPDASQSVQMQC